MEHSKYDKGPEKSMAPDIVGIVKVIRNAWLCLVGPVQRWKWRRGVTKRCGTGDVDAIDQLVHQRVEWHGDTDLNGMTAVATLVGG